MLQNLKAYVRAQSLEQAWDLYMNNREKALFTSGGVSTALREDERTEILIDIQHVLPDSVIETDSQFEIGGGMKINELIDDMDGHHITQVLKKVGTNQIRNMSTLSGSIAQKYGWSDVVTLFLALKASLRVYDGEERIVSLEDYLHGKSKPIILSILFDTRFNFGVFQHMTKTDYDVSQLNFYLCAEIAEGVVKEAGAAYGARPGLALRLPELEGEMKGKTVVELKGNIQQYQKISEAAKVNDGFDLSGEYRKELLGVFIKRSILAL
jgi:CO/xanthine dehydrogenase FAD-binding subunit